MDKISALSQRGVVDDAGLRPNTVYEPHACRPVPSMSTVLAISYTEGFGRNDPLFSSRGRSGAGRRGVGVDPKGKQTHLLVGLRQLEASARLVHSSPIEFGDKRSITVA